MSTSELKFIPLALLKPHPRIQRDFSEKWAAELARDFDPEKLGALSVIPNSGKFYYVWDGQHRAEAARRFFDGDAKQQIPCLVYRDAEDSQLADWFLGRNNAKNLQPIDRFKMRCRRGDGVTLAILNSLTRRGLRVSWNAEPGCVRAVQALEAVYTKSPALMERTLNVLHAAYVADFSAYAGIVVRGLADMLHRYGEGVNDEQLVHVLKTQKDPANLAGEAKAAAKALDVGVAQACSHLLVQLYNRKRRVGKLGEWFKGK